MKRIISMLVAIAIMVGVAPTVMVSANSHTVTTIVDSLDFARVETRRDSPYAWVWDKNNKAGVADAYTGAVIVPLEYDRVSTFNEQGYAIVEKGGKFGVVNLKGKLTVPTVYDELCNNYWVTA